MPPDQGLCDKQQAGIKGKKNRLTYLFVVNADGSKKLAPLIIGKSYKPWAFGGKTGSQLGFDYHNNAKAWMTGTIYQEWLEDWDTKLRKEGRKILLLQDNFSGHIVPNTLTNIHVENFEPNLTAHVQPNDQGIICCFKARYRAKFINCAVDLYEAGVTPSQIYDIDQLEAMRLADEAWNEVDTTTIRNCWRKASILPDTDLPIVQPSLRVPISSLVHATDSSETSNSLDPILQAESDVGHALDDLESTGILQCSNRMNLTELLNPASEAHDVFDVTDHDIYTAVMDAKKVQEGMDSEGSSSNSNAPIANEATPTRNKALHTVCTLRKYTKGINSPFSRKLEVMLGTFGREIRTLGMQSMMDTKITSYFSCT